MPLHQAAVGMQHEVGRELAGRRFGLHARDQLPARRADHLDADEGKLLAEFVDDLLLHLGEGRRVEEELALLARGLDQAVGRLVGRGRPRAADDREACRAPPRTRAPSAGSVRSGSCRPLLAFPDRSRACASARKRAERDQDAATFTADSRRSCSTPRSSRRAA